MSVAINRIRGAPREPFILYIEELADRRCFSIETGFVELLVRLVALTEKGHELRNWTKIIQENRGQLAPVRSCVEKKVAKG